LIHAHRDELIALAVQNGGNTRSDAKFDIDGASGTLAAYAELGAQLGDVKFLTDGDGIQLTRSVRFWGQHIAVPRAGVAVRVNVEADSLNAAVLGPDLERGSDGYSLFIADVVRDMTQKTGQKCTAIRRVLVPDGLLESVREDLVDRLSGVKVGDPAREDV